MLVYGGEPACHDDSVRSARAVYAAMDGEKYEAKFVYVDQRGKWWLLDGWKNSLESHGGRQLLLVPGTRTFITLPGNDIISTDVVFPLIIGRQASRVRALLDALKVPFVGSSAEASILASKPHALRGQLAARGIAVSDSAEIEYVQAVIDGSEGRQLSPAYELHEGVLVDMDEQHDELSRCVEQAYKLSKCHSYGWVSLRLVDATPHIVQVHVDPDFSRDSLFMQMWHRSGMKYPTLIDIMIASAIK